METASKKSTLTPLTVLGNQAEAFAAEWLKKQSYTILACNYRSKYGEIDIIARQKNIIAFVEVKFRTNNYFNLSEVITLSKQKKIIATAFNYCVRSLRNENDLILRFDVALIHSQDNAFSLEYIPNAFTKKSD